ncbi:MAG TPA: GC-type dockerin domain-anchored protein, partial [Gemmatimonadales bacterium]|nr:GC-type dockerin domain-anchored protein [Gemmatimonadales bacterium]
MDRCTRSVAVAGLTGTLLAGSAAGQVRADDYPDELAFRVGVGSTRGTFDHRSPRAADIDLFRFQGETSRLYRATLVLDPSQDEAWVQFEGWVENWYDWDHQPSVVLSAGSAPWMFRMGRVDDLFIQVRGLAAFDGTSSGYTLTIEDLGVIGDDAPGTVAGARVLAVGEVFEGTISPMGDTVNGHAGTDSDVFAVPTLAGRRYRVEVENLTPGTTSPWVATWGYIDAIDPREPDNARYGWPRVFGEDHIDTVVDGTLCFGVEGFVASWPVDARYRVRLIDEGPALMDDHSDWPTGATTLSVGQTVSAVLGDVYREDSYGHVRDEDWFTVPLVAGHRYRAEVSPSAGAGSGARPSFSFMRPQGIDTLTPHTAQGSLEFKAAEPGLHYLRVWSESGVHACSVRVEDLGLAVDDHADAPAGSAVLAMPAMVTGTVDDDVDTDMFRVYAPRGSRLRVALTLPGDTASPVWLTVVQSARFIQGLGQSRIGFGGEMVIDTDVFPENEEGAVWISVTSYAPLDFGFSPTPYTLTVSVLPAGGTEDDWPDTAEGARVLLPGEQVTVRRDRHDDRDVFLADLVAGRVYWLGWGGQVSPGASIPRPHYEFGNSFLQPTFSGRHELTFYGSVDGVPLVDLGELHDDYPWAPRPTRSQAGALISGAIDFDGDVDVFHVGVEQEGVYRLEIAGAGGISAEVISSDTWNRFGARVDRQEWDAENPATPSSTDFAVARLTGGMPSLELRVRGSGAGERRPYAVRVRLVQAFRPSLAGGQTAAEAMPLAVGEHAAAVRTRLGQRFWYRVPVRAGRLYTVVAEPAVYMPFEVTDADGTPACDLAKLWVARGDGWAFVRVKGVREWHRFRIDDLGPASDDAGATLSGAREAALGEAVVGTFDFPGDVDAFRVPLAQDVSYTVSASVQDAGGHPLMGWLAVATGVPDEHSDAFFSTVRDGEQGQLRLRPWDAEPGLLAIALAGSDTGAQYPLSYRVRVWRACMADLAGPGAEPHPDGAVDSNDFILFIERFFAADPLADIGGAGGAARPDGRLDNNDFVVYID